jgi:glutamate/tyrosine decarboxylase-like PLP-dependent enzyme
MFSYDEDLTELILGYCRRRLAQDPVSLDFGGAVPGELDQALSGLIGTSPHRPEDVLAVFEHTLARAVVSCDSPRFLSFIPAAPTKASLLFDMVVSCSSLHGTSWLEAAGAVAAENQALAVLADLAGLPAGAGGCFVSGGSMGNLSALVVARDTAARRLGRPMARPRVAISAEAHSSVVHALGIIGVSPLEVPGSDHRLTGEALARALDADGAADDVVGVVATAGTTNAGIVDDLLGVGRVAAERSLWFHVDAAYGGATIFSPAARSRLAGIELADSFVVDPHKWLFAPFDCAALLYRDPPLAKAVHAQDASYLEAMHPSDEAVFNPSDYAFHLTRRARGLPLWFSLAVHGTDAYRAAVEAGLRIAAEAADQVRARPYLELLREPELSVVLFTRQGWDRADYERWSTALIRDQVAFVMPTTWEGRPAGRLAFLHPDTTPELVAEILDTLA